MNQQAGFAILLFVALLLIVSSVSAKVTAQGSSSEKSTTAANGSCSPELFKAKPALCASLLGLKHTSAKGSGASAEKSTAEKTPVEKLNLFPSSPPIEIKKLPTMEENKGLTGMLSGELRIKKPATSTNPVSEKEGVAKMIAEVQQLKKAEQEKKQWEQEKKQWESQNPGWICKRFAHGTCWIKVQKEKQQGPAQMGQLAPNTFHRGS